MPLGQLECRNNYLKKIHYQQMSTTAIVCVHAGSIYAQLHPAQSVVRDVGLIGQGGSFDRQDRLEKCHCRPHEPLTKGWGLGSCLGSLHAGVSLQPGRRVYYSESLECLITETRWLCLDFPASS